jgi:phosphoglycolate phosphatase
MRKKKNIIFDFDGTIADTIPVMRTIAQQIADESKHPLKLNEVEWEWVRDHTLMEMPVHFGVPLFKIPGLILRGRELIKKQILTVPLCKGIELVLNTLHAKGYTCSILSSSSKDMIQEFLLKHNLVHIFTFVHSELNLFGKDKALTSLMRQNNYDPEETVYVGDEVRDYAACAKIKLDCISVTWGLNSRKALEGAGNTYIIDKAEEIIGLLNS